MEGSASPDYERRFIEPEQPGSMNPSRIPNPTHEYAMWKQNLFTRVPEKYSRDVSWRQRRHNDGLQSASEVALHPQHHFQQCRLVLVRVRDPWHTQCVVPFATRCPISIIRPIVQGG